MRRASRAMLVVGLRRSASAGCAIGAILLTTAGWPTCGMADVLRVQGSTTFNTRLVEPYKPEIETASGHRLEVIPNMSSAGLVALMEGRADVAMIAASLQQEVNTLRAKSPDFPFHMLQTIEIVRVRVAVAAHPSNPVRKMNVADLRRILLGDIVDWRDLGGPSLPIRLVAVRDGGGVPATVQSQVIDGRYFATPNAIRLESRKQVAKVIEQEPAALGLIQPYLLSERGLKEIALDRPIEQALSIVSFGEPSVSIQSLIKALRAVASKNID